MHVYRVDTTEEFDALKASWDTVYAADPHATVFVSWAWLRGWFEVTPHEWFVLAARPDGASPYVAFFPLSIDTRRRQLQMGGNPWADYTGFVCQPEYQREAIESLAVFVQRHLGWDRFRMRDVFDPRLDLFLESFPPRRFSVQEKKGVSCPYISLPSTWERYLQDCLGKRTRKNVRRYMRRVESGSKVRITEVREDNLDRHIDVFLALYQMRWGPQPEQILNQFRTIFQRCFENNSLWLTVLWAADIPISADAGFVDRPKDVFSSYLGGWDDRFAHLSPGDTLVAYSIRYAIEDGFRAYDFLRGSEQYKFSFGAKERCNTDVIITRRSLRWAMRRLVRRLRVAASSNLRGSRLKRVSTE